MQVDKDDVVGLLRTRGEHDKAALMDCALPRHVDTEADAGLLHQFDVNVSEVRAAVGTASTTTAAEPDRSPVRGSG